MSVHVETGWIQTYTGRKLHPLALRVEDVDLRDIAHALGNQCRFAGHTKAFYSVADHCVRVSHVCDPADALWGLLHDASEAYLTDIPRPLKCLPEFAAYREAEVCVMATVCAAFGLPPEQPESVSRADVTLLVTEARDLMAPLHADWHHTPGNGFAVLPEKIIPLTPGGSEWRFLQRARELMGR